ncbi:UDP-glucose dehydrogenase family protein [bacterium]
MRITVVGVGYVGLVTGVCLSKLGHEVLCIDNDQDKIDALKQGIIPIYEPGLEDICKESIKNETLFFSNSIKQGTTFADVIFIAVGTPPKSNGQTDLSYIEDVVIDIAKSIESYKVIVSKSTVPVETGQRLYEIVKSHNEHNVDFDIVSNPEFLKEGSAVHDFLNPDRIVLGLRNDRAKEIMLKVYENLNAPKIITDIESSELIKHASNSFLALKISYANALSQICEKVGADVRQVTQGMGYDKRIGQSFLDAGIGFGGSCFPKDLSSFMEIAKSCGYKFNLLKEVKYINEYQKKYFVKKIKDTLSDLTDKKIAILGLAFKPNTDDMREAPSIDIINELLNEKAKIFVYDPVAMKNAKSIFDDDRVNYCKNIYEASEDADATIILTEWDEFKNIDFEKLKKQLKTPIIIDGRNMFDEHELREKGFIYKGVGC